MIIEYWDRHFDLNDDAQIYFLHEYILYKKYLAAVEQSKDKTDRFTTTYNREVKHVFENKARTGSYEFAKPITDRYDTEKYENKSDDGTMVWKKSAEDYDTLVILLTSFGGHEGRLKSELTNVSEKNYNLPADLLIVNENPYRMPEIIYPAYLIMGCSDENDTMEKMCTQIKSYIKKDYKNVVVVGSSAHTGGAASVGIALQDIVTHVFVTGGHATYDWNYSPIVKKYLKWLNRPKHLQNQHLSITDVEMCHVFKTWKFQSLDLNPEYVDPYRYIGNYPHIQVDYYHGKYDTDYIGMYDYVMGFNNPNVIGHIVDYKISDLQTHNIRPYIDRKTLPEYIKNLTN